MKMKALSVKEPYAGWIRRGHKTLEIRSRRIVYRGDLLICASAKPKSELSGNAVAIVKVVDCWRMAPGDTRAARCYWRPGAWAWVLEDIRPITPFPVKGRLGLFDVELPEDIREETV